MLHRSSNSLKSVSRALTISLSIFAAAAARLLPRRPGITAPILYPIFPALRCEAIQIWSIPGEWRFPPAVLSGSLTTVRAFRRSTRRMAKPFRWRRLSSLRFRLQQAAAAQLLQPASSLTARRLRRFRQQRIRRERFHF